ncbi:MAG: hypothetical protein RIC57_03535 [Balneola sp.]
MSEIPESVQWIVDSGLSAALLGVLIWVVKSMLTQFNKSSTLAFEAIEKITSSKDAQIDKNFDAHIVLSDKILDMTQQFHDDDSERQDMIIRILTRLEEKLDQPVRCPAQSLKES